MPAQIIEAPALVLIFILLIIASDSIRKKGAITLVYAATYAVCRFVIEFFLGDVRRVFDDTRRWFYKIYVVRHLKKKSG